MSALKLIGLINKLSLNLPDLQKINIFLFFNNLNFLFEAYLIYFAGVKVLIVSSVHFPVALSQINTHSFDIFFEVPLIFIFNTMNINNLNKLKIVDKIITTKIIILLKTYR